MATDATFPPSAFYGSNKELVGFDVELARAIAGVLDLEPRVQAEAFDSIIPGLQSGKFTVGMSLINITEERKEVLDFIEYFRNGSSLLTSADSDIADDAELSDLCGRSVAVQRAAVQATFVEEASTDCENSGKQPIDAKIFPDYNAATLAIAGQRVDAGLFDQTNAGYTASQEASKLRVVGEPFGQTPCGIATAKDNELAPALKAALDSLMADGTYDKLLAEYGLDDGAVEAATVNP